MFKKRDYTEGAILSVRDLHTSFFTVSGEVKAVNGVSFDVESGKVLGIVGESGSGKSVTAYSIMQILTFPGRVVGGEIIFKGKNLLELDKKEMRKVRGDQISMIFQDPMTSLNPTKTIENQIGEAIKLHTERRGKEMCIRDRLNVRHLHRVGADFLRHGQAFTGRTDVVGGRDVFGQGRDVLQAHLHITGEARCV